MSRSQIRFALLSFLPLVLVLAGTSFADEKAQVVNTNSTPVFRTGTRLVLVDVVATDASGKPIHGLKPQDFAVFEAGKPQALRSFEEHTSDEIRPAPAEDELVLAPGVYSNWSSKTPSGAVNIILFDTLNMSWQDQAYARMSMIDYLKSLPSGQQVALFTLGDHLRMVQNFTGRSDTLIAAAKKLGALPHLSPVDSGLQADRFSQLHSTGAGSKTDPNNQRAGINSGSQSDRLSEFQATLPSGLGEFGSSVVAQLQDFLQEESNTMANIRTDLTLEALRELARYVASAPGRKNLIWISGSFPLVVGSYTERSRPTAYNPIYDRELRKTAALLAAHQIAVYPIDARGLLTPVVGAERTGYAITTTSSTDAAAGYKSFLNSFSAELQATHDSMDELAQQTGGRAFYGSNGISNAIGASITSGANYYTLSYTPANKQWDGQLRKIEVKVSRRDAKLNYRRGYYAIADPFAPVLKIKTTKLDVQQRLIEAVQPNAPQVSGVLMKVKAPAPSAIDKPVEIEYVIDASSLTVAESENGKRKLRYQLVAVAWDKNDQNAGQAWQMIDEDIPAGSVTEILSQGIHSRRSIMLKPGKYHLCVGIIDVESKKVGTVVIPLNIPKELAVLK